MWSRVFGNAFAGFGGFAGWVMLMARARTAQNQSKLVLLTFSLSQSHNTKRCGFCTSKILAVQKTTVHLAFVIRAMQIAHAAHTENSA